MNYLEAIVELKNIIDPRFINKIIPLMDKKCKRRNRKIIYALQS